MHSVLRSTAAYTTSMSLQPVLLNRFGERDQMPDVGVTASTLRGIRLSALPEAGQSPAAQQRIDDSARGQQAVEGAGRVETGYDAVMRQFAEADEALRVERESRETTAIEKSWMERIRELQEQVGRGPQQPTPPEGETPGETPDGAPEEGAPDDLDTMKELGVYDEETVELLRSIREPVKRLVDPATAANRDPYAEHMEVGQRLLTQERFFDAEERFTRAIGIRSGDVMAQVGRMHAQIGAGMYISAALNMRVLLVQHPEVVGVRYDDVLLPGAERRRVIMERLAEKAGVGLDAPRAAALDEQMRRECGLLLAYFGYQLGDARALDDGLDAFEAVTAKHADDPVYQVDVRLLELLRRVWQGGDPATP